MKNENTKIKQPSEKCKKLTPNSVCYKKNLLCINDNELYGEERKHVKNYNNKDVSGILSFYLFNFNLFLTYEYVVIIFIKLITIYFFFISPFVLIMADEVNNSLTISGSPSGDFPSPSNALGTSDLQSGFTTKLTQLCKTYFPNSPICQSPEVMGMLGFFIFSTVISLIFGIFRRCIFRCKTCCIYGTRSSRRKRMEEERQENEMFEQQMSSLQMRKNLLTRQQKSLQALMQGSQGNDKKKKKKSSKKETENSTNIFGVGYMPVSQ